MFTSQSLLLRVHFIPFHHLSYFSSFMLSDFHSLFSHLYSITFHFYYNLSFYLQFYCDNYFSFFFVNNGKDACLHSGYSPIGICQLVNEKYDMDSSFQKIFTRDKLGMEALTQPYFYKTVHSPLWLGLSLFLLFFFQTKPFTFILLSFFSI